MRSVLARWSTRLRVFERRTRLRIFGCRDAMGYRCRGSEALWKMALMDLGTQPQGVELASDLHAMGLSSRTLSAYVLHQHVQVCCQDDAQGENARIVLALALQSGADPQGWGRALLRFDECTEETLLHHAARRGNLATVKILLGQGALIDSRDSTGKTALEATLSEDPKDRHPPWDLRRRVVLHLIDAEASPWTMAPRIRKGSRLFRLPLWCVAPPDIEIHRRWLGHPDLPHQIPDPVLEATQGEPSHMTWLHIIQGNSMLGDAPPHCASVGRLAGYVRRPWRRY
jgi:hypothetical protein